MPTEPASILQPALVQTKIAPQRYSSLWFDAWRRLRRNRRALLGFGMLLLIVLIAVTAPIIAPYDPLKVNLRGQFIPPSLQHPFGTDFYGRDVLSRVMYGLQISLVIGLIPSFFAIVIGALLGLLSGYYGRATDTIIMRLADIVLAFPSILLAMAITYTLGASLFTLFIALSVVSWGTVARVVRSQALSLKEREYVSAAQSVGSGGWRIMSRHILPNTLAPIIVLFTFLIPDAILTEASLSFLGVGAQPPTPSLGLMVSEGQQYLFKAPWASLMPGLAILVIVLAFNFAGDGLRDAMDPYLESK